MTTTIESFLDRLKQHVLLGDGAMGTMLYERGVFLNTCFDELNLTRPDLVGQVHRDYLDAGVDFIETNTFGASEIRLAPHGLADKVEDINNAAVAIARKAAASHPDTLIAGAVGPLGQQLPPFGRFDPELAADNFRRQCQALADSGIDFFILETFSSPQELLIAAHAARQAAPHLPIVGQLTIDQHQETIFGQSLTDAVTELENDPAINVIGLNCSVGPSAMLHALETLRSLTQKPISIQPNAGLPRQIDGRNLYMTTPEYMAEFAKRFFEKGARVIGGCCGTTPAHIRQIVKAVRSLDKASHVALTAASSPTAASQTTAPPPQQPAIPLEQRSKLGRKLVEKHPITSIEITPPRGFDLTAIVQKAQRCAELGIDAINIPDGPRASSRLSPMITALKIQQSVDIETILHICCRDRNLISMQSDILGAYAMQLNNVLLITGDPPKLGEFPDATAVFDLDAIGLTRVVNNLNHGIDIAGNGFAPPVGMTISVGANPVAADLPREIDRFKQKVAAGAEYAITQPVFDPQMLFDFLDAVADHPIPVIAGIWPFTSYKNAEFMANEVPGVVVPDTLLQRMSKAKTKEQGRILGIEIAREMIQAIAPRVAGYAVSAPFGNVNIALAALDRIPIEDV